MADIADRYVEQLSTTAETLRRRFVAYYDGVVFAGQRLGMAAERTKEVVEPATYDLKDYVAQATAVTEPLGQLEKDFRNTLVEVYLGLSVLMTGLSCAYASGALALGPLLERVFDGYMELVVLALMPPYIYLTLKKTPAMDDLERRTTLFGMALVMGALSGHLMPSLVSMALAIHFVPPLVFALLLDNELLVTPLPSMDRVQFFAISGAISATIATILGVVPLGGFSIAVLLTVTAHAALLALHCQLTCQMQKDKIFSNSESQFAYVIGIFVLQVLTAAVFGVNPLTQDTSSSSQ